MGIRVGIQLARSSWRLFLATQQPGSASFLLEYRFRHSQRIAYTEHLVTPLELPPQRLLEVEQDSEGGCTEIRHREREREREKERERERAIKGETERSNKEHNGNFHVEESSGICNQCRQGRRSCRNGPKQQRKLKAMKYIVNQIE